MFLESRNPLLIFAMFLGDLKNSGRLPVQQVLVSVLSSFEISSLFMFLRSRNPLLTFLLSYHVWRTSTIHVTFRFKRFSKFLDKNALNLKAIVRRHALRSHFQCFIVNFIVMSRHVPIYMFFSTLFADSPICFWPGTFFVRKLRGTLTMDIDLQGSAYK